LASSFRAKVGRIMLTVGLLGVLAGVVFGTHFRVFILVPAMILACAVIAAFGAGGHDTFWWAAVVMLVAVAALQTGYLVGITRALWADAHAPRLRTSSRSPAA
jgi:uncharacterized membrane protein